MKNPLQQTFRIHLKNFHFLAKQKMFSFAWIIFFR